MMTEMQKDILIEDNCEILPYSNSFQFRNMADRFTRLDRRRMVDTVDPNKNASKLMCARCGGKFSAM
jgi:hypothetical protein